MQTQTGIDTNVAAQFLRNEYQVAIPTETVYGLAANALSEKAVLKIFKLKNRPAFDPLIIHVSNLDALHKYVKVIPEKAKKLADKFWPGPLTILFEKLPVIPDLVTSGLNTVAVRVPAHPLTQQLLKLIDFPLAAPSANPFGYISPTTAEHVLSHFNGKIPYILDGGPCSVGIESTIVGFEKDQCIVYRLGGVPVNAIKECVGNVALKLNMNVNPTAPGQLMSHYAPSVPMCFGDEEFIKHELSNAALICFQKPGFILPDNIKLYELSPDGDFEEAAHNLFSVMRAIDNSDVELIIALKFPDEGIGKAINDRLSRAVAKR